MGSYNSFRESIFWMNNKQREKKTPWFWSSHGGRILEHDEVFLEHFGSKY
jgi:hypothetical protein